MKCGLGRRHSFEVCVHAHAFSATQTTSLAAAELCVDQRLKCELLSEEGDPAFLHKRCAVRVAPVTPSVKWSGEGGGGGSIGSWSHQSLGRWVRVPECGAWV